MKRFLLLVVCYFLCTAITQAQSVTITGKVLDENSNSLPGANVIVKGTTEGTTTDFDGKFTLKVPSSTSTIVATFMGYDNQEVTLTGQTEVTITLSPNAIGLDEVVAIGYGSKKRSVVTGAITSLTSEELLQSKPANITSAMNGRAAGVTVMQGSGQPGSSPKIVIRGVGTNGNSDPLYLVDGLPITDLNSVNPSDIESMEVLKDATSTAIYGARGANGVVLIKTKQGKIGKTNLSYNGFFGVQKAYNQPQLLNDKQYVELMQEVYTNDDKPYPETMPTATNGINTNWLEEIAQPAEIQEHNISISAGSEKSSVMFSLGYRDQKGIIGGDKSFFKRYTARMNSIINVNDFITVGANLNYAHINRNGVSTGTNGYNPVYYALQMDPLTPVYDDSSADDRGFGVSPVPFTRMWNPMQFMDVTSNGTNLTETFSGNTYLQLNLVDGLVFRSDLAVNFRSNSRSAYSPTYEHNPDINLQENRVSQNSERSTFWQWENTLTYTKKIGEHKLTGLVGTTAFRNNRTWLGASRNNLPIEADNSNDFWYLDSGDSGTAVNNGGADAQHSVSSIFSRLSYNYKEKYMAEVVVRRDGSSNFGPNFQYAVFPAVSVGWNATNEEFWNFEQINHLKLRLSWGQNGNEAIRGFSYTSVIKNDRYYTLGSNHSVVAGSSPESLVNPHVKWETSEQTNFGIDIGMFNNRLRGSFDYYTKTTKDLLLKPTLEAVRGNDSPYYNIGKVKNTGLEFQLAYNFKLADVDFVISGNASYLKNKVVKVGNDNGYLEGGSWNGNTNVTRMQDGLPIGYFYGYKTDGIFQTQEEIEAFTYVDTDNNTQLTYPKAAPGDFKWNDANGDGQITADDRQVIGNPWPKWTFGANLSAKWRGIDASIFLNGKANVDVYMAQYRTEGIGRANMPSFYMDRWTQPGDNNGVPRLTLDDPNQNFKKASDFYVKDASFIKIGTIELGYTLPKSFTSKMKMSKLRLYVAVDNAAIFTKYPMFDPEIGDMNNNNILNTGLDYSMYPQARTIRGGLTIGF